MVKIDLDAHSLADLKELQKDLDLAIDRAEKRERKEALEKLEEQARDMGFTLSELLSMKEGGGRKTGKPRAPAEPKYRHPEDPSITWTGRGRKPNWIKEGLEKGQPIEDFLIA
ncbi:MAG: H-NS histone family protein [Rhodobacteraceae bacterium]|jgi:DNA-binding protein H-NS|nr:H-NS histone family protein [Paracoccaceae bacterium]